MPSPGGMAPDGGVRAGAAARAGPGVAEIVTPCSASSPSIWARRWPGCGWVTVHGVVELLAPWKHWTSVSWNGADASTVALVMPTGQYAPTAFQDRRVPLGFSTLAGRS